MDPILELEAAVDAGWERMPLPSPTREASIWHALITAEDLQRLPIAQGEELNAAMANLNHAKFLLREVLELINRVQKESAPLVRVLDDDAYGRAAELLKAAHAFQIAIVGFTEHHKEGGGRWHRVPGTSTLKVVRDGEDFSSTVLDGLLGGRESTPAGAVWTWLNDARTRQRGDVLDVLAEITSRDGEHGVIVPYVHELAASIAAQLPKVPRLLPEDWESGAGTGSDVIAVLDAFQARCAYHALAVILGARRHDVVGIGLPSCVLTLRRDELIKQVAGLASRSNEVTARVLSFLTYGNRTTSPDPALQPIVEIEPGVVDLSPFVVISSNAERNFLTLHVRIDRKQFDRQSYAFETRMLTRLGSMLTAKRVPHRARVNVPGMRSVGDLDLVMADTDSKCLVLAECYWSIEPADPNEVRHRRETIAKKHAQIVRKCDAARSKLQPFLELLIPGVDTAGWQVRGVVIVAGYSDATAADEGADVFEMRLFELAVAGADRMRDAMAWLDGATWRPRVGVHYEVIIETGELGGVTMEWPGVGLLNIDDLMNEFERRAALLTSTAPAPAL